VRAIIISSLWLEQYGSIKIKLFLETQKVSKINTKNKINIFFKNIIFLIFQKNGDKICSWLEIPSEIAACP
jgi:hypothetical protein